MSLVRPIRVGATGGLVLAAALLSAGCTTPTDAFKRTVQDAGFTQHVIPGNNFDLLILAGRPAGTSDERLHVYIEGDGSAWISNRWIAKDPTPRHPVALTLMRLDPAPTLYLGRPCYLGLQRNCTPDLWTKERYSEAVVQEMCTALKDYLDKSGFMGSIVLIGFSGGGTLAMLMASRLAAVDRLVTVAANLDTARWTRLHGYSPLTNSLNPAAQAPLPERINQIHLVGGSDQNVPVEIVEDAIARQPNAVLLSYPEFTHNCCWVEVWPDVLDRIGRE